MQYKMSLLHRIYSSINVAHFSLPLKNDHRFHEQILLLLGQYQKAQEKDGLSFHNTNIHLNLAHQFPALDTRHSQSHIKLTTKENENHRDYEI